MSTKQFLTIILGLQLLLNNFYELDAMKVWFCKKCLTEAECDEPPPEPCIWGEDRNACGKRVCSKGPGEKCGGKHHIMGKCGEGMMCSITDNRCHGCYIQTMTCYPYLMDK